MASEPTNIIGIDPGPGKSAAVGWSPVNARVEVFQQRNPRVAEWLRGWNLGASCDYVLAIEQVKCYGRAVGDSVLMTAFWSGAFADKATQATVYLLPRQTVGAVLCETPKATKSETRRALIDRFGGDKAIGTKKNGMGPLYNVKGHAWDALAVAVAWRDLNKRGELDRCYRVPR